MARLWDTSRDKTMGKGGYSLESLTADLTQAAGGTAKTSMKVTTVTVIVTVTASARAVV